MDFGGRFFQNGEKGGLPPLVGQVEALFREPQGSDRKSRVPRECQSSICFYFLFKKKQNNIKALKLIQIFCDNKSCQTDKEYTLLGIRLVSASQLRKQPAFITSIQYF